MHVALLTDGIYPHVLGGIQKHSFYLAKYFAKNKIKVDLYHPVCAIHEKNFLHYFTPEEIKYIHPVFIDFPKSFYFPGHYIYESYSYSKNIFAEYIQRSPVDFIYAQGFTGWELIKQKSSKKCILPPIGVNFHGLNMFQKAFGLRNHFNNILFKPFVKYNIQNADRIFSLGGKLTELIYQNIGITKNIIEIPIGIDESWLINHSKITTNSVLQFAFIGRYDKVKGFKLLNPAIKKAIKTNSTFHFKFIGPIPNNVQIKNINVMYFGEIHNDTELKTILKQCDIIISSSYSEGMPTAILEAMACGLAVIATNVGAVSELVNEHNGILIPPGDSKAIETAIIRFANMSSLELLEMKKCSLQKVKERFLWEKIFVQTIKEIEKAITS
jgi:glycosyltransferase involved in cell wall biosynthesis